MAKRTKPTSPESPFAKTGTLSDSVSVATVDEDFLRRAIELLFFAYRDFTAGPDAILAEFGFGRAHHRVIYFVGRDPGISVRELLETLKITKQSLSRVLGQLVDEEFIGQKTDVEDRRRRLLNLTTKGSELERRLSETQFDLITAAYQKAGGNNMTPEQGFHAVLMAMINESDGGRFDEADD